MAESFPLPVFKFFLDLPIREVTFRLDAVQSVSQTAGGDVIPHQIGARLWRGEIVLDKEYHRAAAYYEARLALLQEPQASFMLFDPRVRAPAYDPDGALVAGADVRIATLSANARDLTLKNLPPGYELTRGDLMGWSYGSDPVRHALHRVVRGGTAGGDGTTPEIEVVPAVRDGVAADAPVTLIEPALKARVVSAEYGRGRSRIAPGGRLSWIQTLR